LYLVEASNTYISNFFCMSRLSERAPGEAASFWFHARQEFGMSRDEEFVRKVRLSLEEPRGVHLEF